MGSGCHSSSISGYPWGAKRQWGGRKQVISFCKSLSFFPPFFVVVQFPYPIVVRELANYNYLPMFSDAE